MTNYAMIQMGNCEVPYLVNEDFSSLTFAIPKDEMDSLLKNELEKNFLCMQVLNHYELFTKELKFGVITAPLYIYDGEEKPKLIAESETKLCPLPLTEEYAGLFFDVCKKNVTKNVETYFEHIYNSNTLDNGISSTIHFNDMFKLAYITDEYERYIPKQYIKVYEQKAAFNARIVLFIKNQDFNGKLVKIKVENQIKKVLLRNNGKKLKDIAKMINANRIEIIS